MRQFEYVIENLAPVCFTEQSGDNVLYETRRFVPGSSLVGALAAKYINKNHIVNAHKDPVFKELFLSGKVRFLPAYPCTKDGVKSLPLPMSLMIHKDGMTLADYAAGKEFAPGYKKLAGFGIVDEADKTLSMLSARVQFEFHMSRASESERLSGSSNDGKVFNYEYLEPFQYFYGTVIADDDLSDAAMKAIAELLSERVGLGRSRSAQYGKAEFTFMGEKAPQKIDFNEGRLCIYAYSAFIPSENWTRADELALYIADALNNELVNSGSEAKLSKENIGIFAAGEALEGFVGVWNVKRERKNVLSSGSLFAFDVIDFDDDALAVIDNRLCKGFGERIAEGFGQFRIWTPLKDSADKTWQKVALREKSSTIPSLDAVKVDALTIIAGRIMQEIRLQAKNDVLSMTISDKGKGTLKRIEALADSDKDKSEIMAAVSDFRKTARDNLFKMRLNGKPVLHMILEEENLTQPYDGIDWMNRLGLSSKAVASLKADLGISDMPFTENEVFKEYWLWFARHGAKTMKKEEENRGFSMNDAKISAGKGEA